MTNKIAIIGAGMAGAACGRELSRMGCEVVVIEREARAGGRMGTFDLTDKPSGKAFAVDYGAQYFTARDAGFKEWIRGASIEVWTPRIEASSAHAKLPTADNPWFVGARSMPSAPAQLLAGLRVVVSTEIVRIDKTARNTFILIARHEQQAFADEEFDAVVIATAPRQAAPLVASHAPNLASYAEAAKLSPCWAAMMVMGSHAITQAPDVILPAEHSPLGWIARDTSKPGHEPSDGLETWVTHASAEWSTTHLDDSAGTVTPLLLRAFADEIKRTSGASPEIRQAQTYLWLQAKAARAPDGTPPAAFENGLALCGDYLIGGRVEAAYLSGIEAARLLLAE